MVGLAKCVPQSVDEVLEGLAQLRLGPIRGKDPRTLESIPDSARQVLGQLTHHDLAFHDGKQPDQRRQIADMAASRRQCVGCVRVHAPDSRTAVVRAAARRRDLRQFRMVWFGIGHR